MKATAKLMGEVSRAGAAASSFGAKFSCNLVYPFNYVSLYFCVSLKSATRCAFHKSWDIKSATWYSRKSGQYLEKAS